MTAKHTTGPWFQQSCQGISGLLIVNESGIALADCNPSSIRILSRQEISANARLIAASPKMLAAIAYQIDLNQWVESADPESPVFEETLRLRLNTANDYMREAFTEATGEESP